MLFAQLSAVDVAIVVVYGLATLLLGVWFNRRQRDLNTYFVGDRNVSWWLVLVSIVATETSTVTFLSVPGLAFSRETATVKGGNLMFLQLAFGYVIGRILIAWLLLPQYLHGRLVSAYQLLRERFSGVRGEVIGVGSKRSEHDPDHPLGGSPAFYEFTCTASEVEVDEGTGEILLVRHVSVADVGKAEDSGALQYNIVRIDGQRSV